MTPPLPRGVGAHPALARGIRSAYQGCPEAVAAYVGLSPDTIGQPDPNGLTPLHYAINPITPEPEDEEAAAARAAEIVGLLLGAGADPNALDGQGHTAPILAYAHEQVWLVSAVLARCFADFVRAGIDLAIADPEGKTLPHHAAVGGDVSTLQLALEHGFETGTVDGRGETVRPQP